MHLLLDLGVVGRLTRFRRLQPCWLSPLAPLGDFVQAVLHGLQLEGDVADSGGDPLLELFYFGADQPDDLLLEESGRALDDAVDVLVDGADD